MASLGPKGGELGQYDDGATPVQLLYKTQMFDNRTYNEKDKTKNDEEHATHMYDDQEMEVAIEALDET